MPADLVLAGGPVFTADPARPRVAGVAVRAGRIVAVGHDDVRGLLGPRTELVDVTGRLLLPGFQDAHAHPVQGGTERLACDLSALSARADYLAAVAAYASAHPDREWVTGGGWQLAAFPGGLPRREDLDAVAPGRPVLLPNRDHHGAWVSSRALELAGVDATTPDPPDGRIERDPDGTPTGVLHEGAVAMVGRFVPPPTPRQLLDALLEAQSHLHSLGVTAWQDAILGDYSGHPDPSQTYLDAATSGRLTARVVGALWWDRDRGGEQVGDLLARRERLQAGRFRATSVKIMQDGVPENFTAAMLEPYRGDHGSGHSFVDPDALREHVSALDAAGFQVHVHAIGDRAVREALDAFAEARRRNGPNDNRHHVAHLQVVHPDDVPRFGALGVAANLQPLWAVHEPQMDELVVPFLGPERASWQYPFRDLQRTGAVLAMGSDWPVTSADPLEIVHVAVNRVPPGEHGSTEPFLPQQRLDLAAALTAYTAGSAYVNHLDDTGTIAEGRLADLVVLDRDPFAGPPEEIATTRVLRTIVEGETVWHA